VLQSKRAKINKVYHMRAGHNSHSNSPLPYSI
jgi:hypothetical protein